MKILNIGSLNIDYTYSVEHFVRAGETLAARTREEHCGGKGLNQSIALARAGAKVYHAGCIGAEGTALVKELRDSGADTSLILRRDIATGHAVIQVDPTGQNCILIFGGANREISNEDIDDCLSAFSEGDILLLQNETSGVAYAIEQAARKGMYVALNPSPISEELLASSALKHVHWFILNEIEGYELSGEREPERICTVMREKYPGSTIVLTLGGDGCMLLDDSGFYRHGAYSVSVVDTTGAGDTFAGYFLGCTAAGMPVEETLAYASMAAAIAVGRPGAAASIPLAVEVRRALAGVND